MSIPGINFPHLARRNGPVFRSLQFSKTFVVQANQAAQDAGVESTNENSVVITQVTGSWTQNPATGFHDWRGDGAHANAGGEFALPHAPEGCLLMTSAAGIPSSGLMCSQVSPSLPQNIPFVGGVFFLINDDLKGVSGAGLTDNSGSLTVFISVFGP